MPELPDVENFRKLLVRHALHKKIEHVEVGSAKILEGVSARELARKLEGRSFEGARRHGKHLFAALDEGHCVGFHFGLTGRFVYFKDGEEDPRHDRLRLDFPHREHFCFVDQRLFGRVEWIDDPDEYIRKKKLGPDALSIGEQAFREALAARRGALKPALMDQTLLAGIGNLYSDEILFQAKLHPKTPASDLDGKAIKRLYRVMRRVLETAVEKGAGAEEDLERRLPKGWLLPHRKKGGECPRCGGKIATLKVEGRTAYFCPACQPAPRAGR
ncbi:MAG TPA: DNA-formamidopyrimidine glycosylase family protein [Gammaproteobacteria bacterium]|nr:DNA-formamidopyrimidine glycosylase family protein [Gammaproteobacteria bacterium]